MKVFIAMEYDYEDSRILGVYADEETAYRDGNAKRTRCDWSDKYFYSLQGFKVETHEVIGE